MPGKDQLAGDLVPLQDLDLVLRDHQFGEQAPEATGIKPHQEIRRTLFLILIVQDEDVHPPFGQQGCGNDPGEVTS